MGATDDSVADMAIEIRTAREDDREVLHDMSQQAFMHRSSAFDADADRLAVSLDRRLVAEVDGTIGGKLSVWELGQWFGFRRVPMGGIAGVAVKPEFRGRKIATELLRVAVRDMRDRGEVLSSLFPMNHTLYRRAGWQTAGRYPRHEVSVRSLLDLPRPSRSVTFRAMADDDLPRLKEIHDAMSWREPGNLWYGDAYAARRLRVQAGKPGDAYVAEISGVVSGSVTVFREEPSSDREFYSLDIGSMVAADRDTELAIWRFVGANYPIAHLVRFVAPPERTLTHLLGEREIYPTGPDFAWMARLVDAPRAIAGRGFADHVSAEVHLSISDHIGQWNAGRFVLRVENGKGSLEPGGSGRVALGVGELASIYTGWCDPFQLATWELLSGGSDDDLAALHRAFAGPTPWMRDFF